MLEFISPSGRFSRRSFLQVGSLALGSGVFSGLQENRAWGDKLGLPITGKSVVFLFMQGGPSQIETFDPKMSAPAGIRSANGEVTTTLPGITYGAALPKLAARAHRTSIVRSFQTGDGKHDIKPVVSKHTSQASLGSLYSRVAGTNRPDTGMPTSIVLYPQAVDDAAKPAFKEFGDFETSGTLGSNYAAFAPSGGSELKENLKLHLPLDRLGDRRALLSGLDHIYRRLDTPGAMQGIDSLRQQAFDALLGGVAAAFDLSQEDPATVARYDTNPLVRKDSIDTRWNNHELYADNACSLGKLMLLARRLCERGCGFVTVTTNFVWDMHADVNNAGMEEGMRYMGLPFDHAVATFLDDVHDRGLDQEILLVCCGEMGRTPKLNAKGGRDHWGALSPLLLAGGGLRMGQVIGQSTRDAAEPLSEPIRIPQLISTILQTITDPSQVRLVQGMPREVIQAAAAAPIPGL